MAVENKNEQPNRQITTVRTFEESRTEVFSAWTNAEALAKWWGPKGFTNTFYQFDAKPGGQWKFTMHGPNGGDYPNESVFVEINEPEKIVLHHISKPIFRLTARFEEVDESKTKLIFEQLFSTVEEYNNVKGFAIDANEENMDHLAELLKSMK